MGQYQKLLFGVDAAFQEQKQASKPVDTCKPWATPANHSEVIGMDFGGGKISYHCVRSGREESGSSLGNLFALVESFPGRALLLTENAHATPQTDKSLSQPYTKEELFDFLELCQKRNITVRYAPCYHTRKVREWVAENGPDGFVEAEKTTDLNDARALAYYAENNNRLSMIKPWETFDRCPSREYGSLVRGISNNNLNASRTFGYDCRALRTISDLADGILNRVATKNSFFSKKPAAFAIASLVACEIDGMPVRFTYQGNQPGLGFFKRKVLLMSPCHHDGGVARSNIMWHALRPWLSGFASRNGTSFKDGASYIRFADFSEEQERVRLAGMKQFRKEIAEAYRCAVELCKSFSPYEVLDHQAFK
jgi:hypothetical protein